jgi:hypothetical protein
MEPANLNTTVSAMRAILTRARSGLTNKSGQQWLMPTVSTDWNQPPQQQPQTDSLIGFQRIRSRVKKRTESSSIKTFSGIFRTKIAR